MTDKPHEYVDDVVCGANEEQLVRLVYGSGGADGDVVARDDGDFSRLHIELHSYRLINTTTMQMKGQTGSHSRTLPIATPTDCHIHTLYSLAPHLAAGDHGEGCVFAQRLGNAHGDRSLSRWNAVSVSAVMY